MTDTEQYLWQYLRKQQLQGVQFRRQYVIGPYIVDFICFQSRLIVECDGGQHASQQIYDQERDVYLKAQGFRILRFWNNEILENIEGVLEVIGGHLTPPP